MKKQCTLDQNEYINEFIAGGLNTFSLVRLRWHHSHCTSCKSEWATATQLQASLRQVAIVEPPPALRSRIWSQLPEITLPESTRTLELRKARKLQWAIAGIVTAMVLTAGGVTAQMVLDPIRKQYAIMHEDTNLSTPLSPTDGTSGITSRLDGLYGHDSSTGMRWRVTGRIKVSIFSLPSGDLLSGGETTIVDKSQLDKARSLMGSKTYSHLMGLNPIADPHTPPVLTVNRNGEVKQISGYGTFTVFDKWQFEIEPILNKP